MKKIVTTIGLFFCFGCGVSSQSYTISDVTKPEIITIHKRKSQGNIYGIKIVGKGYIDGEAVIHLILNGKEYQTKNLSGNITFQWGGDWYSDSAEIRYAPVNVKNGNIVLRYNFRDL